MDYKLPTVWEKMSENRRGIFLTHTVQVMREQITTHKDQWSISFINKQRRVSSEHPVSTELRELIITKLHSYATCKVCNIESANCQRRITGSNYATTVFQNHTVD